MIYLDLQTEKKEKVEVAGRSQSERITEKKSNNRINAFYRKELKIVHLLS